MADKIKVWFDAEADYLEVRFSDAAGYDKETKHYAVVRMVRPSGNQGKKNTAIRARGVYRSDAGYG